MFFYALFRIAKRNNNLCPSSVPPRTWLRPPFFDVLLRKRRFERVVTRTLRIVLLTMPSVPSYNAFTLDLKPMSGKQRK